MRREGTRARLRAAAVGALFLALTANCSWFSDETPPAPAGLPQSWIWSAASGISLSSQDARAVRGWVESVDIYQNAGVSYPGFPEATSAELRENLKPAVPASQEGGTTRHLLRSVKVTGSELKASLCSDGWAKFGFLDDGAPLGGAPDLVLHTLTMRKDAPTLPAESSAAAQQALVADASPDRPANGHSPYDVWLKGPKENVFNDWIAISWDVDVDPPPDCITWFKQNHPGLNYPTGFKPETRPNRPTTPPPPTLPSSPGW